MVLFLGEDMEVGIVQSVYQDGSKNSVVLEVREEEYTIFLSDEEFRKLQIHFQNQENLVIPINMKTFELFLDTDQTELEEALEELVEAADRGGE